MATAQIITRDNFTTLLSRSSEGREGGGTPDGNVYFDTTNDRIQLISVEEAATVDLGSGLEANPFTNALKIQNLALYFFILQEVEADNALQNFRFAMDAVSNRMGKLVGATGFLSAYKLADGSIDATGVGGSLGDDRLKVADSGFTEFAAGSGGNTLTDRVYHGAKSQNPIDAGSQPFYQIAASLSESDRQAAVPIDFSKLGDVNEVIQTLGDTANGDSGAGDFDDLTSVLILGVRDYGFSVGETSSQAAGVSELGAYLQGYALGNTAAPSISAITESEVFGGGIIAPFTGLGFYRHASAQTQTGFVEGNGDFTDEITNTGGATLVQIRAWMDKVMQQDTDQNDNTGSTGSYIPKRAEPLYTIDAATGKLVTRVGLFIANVPAADSQNIIYTADNATTRTNPVVTPINFKLSDAWLLDSKPWFRALYADGSGGLDFDTASAVTVEDSAPTDIAGGSGAAPFLSAMDIDAITWQSGTTVRITFNGSPSLAALNSVSKLVVTTATNASNNGSFKVTAFDDGADWVEITNAARTDGTDDEATDSPAVADLWNYDSRLVYVAGGVELRTDYAYSTNSQAGLAADADKDIYFQVGGIDNTKSRTFGIIQITTATLSFDASTDQETN